MTTAAGRRMLAEGGDLMSNCTAGYHGLLCGECEEGWAQTKRGCVECDPADAVKFFVSVIVLAVLGSL